MLEHLYDGERCVHCGVNAYDADLDGACPADGPDRQTAWTSETGHDLADTGSGDSAPCTGDGVCQASPHWHGCLADLTGDCDDPADHGPSSARSGDAGGAFVACAIDGDGLPMQFTPETAAAFAEIVKAARAKLLIEQVKAARDRFLTEHPQEQQ